MASLAPVPQASGAAVAESAAAAIGEPLEQNTAAEQMEAESSRVSAGRARVDRPLNGAIQWATSYIDSAAALPAGVFVHRRDACKWSR